MATYYFNRDDLTARLNKTACWAHNRALTLSKHLKYEGRIDDCAEANLSLVVAYLEVMECYTPITSSSDDFNCLTEAEAEQIFENISKLTGLCFVPKNTAYLVDSQDDNNQFRTPTRTTGAVMTLIGGAAISYNILTREKLTRI